MGLLSVLTDAFTINALMNTGSAMSVIIGKSLIAGGGIITCIVHNQHRIMRSHQSLQQAGESEKLKVYKPTLTMDGCS
jgi:hypothetical protein